MALICELDEQWSYIGSKARQHWLWYAYNTKTGGVLADTFGSPSRQPDGCGLSWPEITVIKTDNIIVFQVVIWPVQLNPVNENPPLKEANFPAMS